MKILSNLAVSILLALAACAEGGKPSGGDDGADAAKSLRPGRSLGEALAARYPGLELEAVAESAAVPGTENRYGTFAYRTRGKEGAYGTGVAVWRAGSGEPVWTHLHPGDFAPHTVAWMDVDGDGRRDLFFLSGFENVFQTDLFLARDAEGDSAFVPVYQARNGYSALGDLDGDGAPEILDPGREDGGDGDAWECGLQVPPSVDASAAAEYARIAGAFDAANFKYGFPRAEQFAASTLNLFEPVRVLRVRGGRVEDVSRDFAAHMAWREGALREVRDASPDACRALLDPVLAHVRALRAG